MKLIDLISLYDLIIEIYVIRVNIFHRILNHNFCFFSNLKINFINTGVKSIMVNNLTI